MRSEKTLITSFTGLSHRGRRPRNEDCLRWDRELGFAAVADGLGGHPAGDVASRVAIEVVWAALVDAQPTPSSQLPKAVLRAHQAVRTLAASRADYQTMGTTLVAALFEHDCVHVAHVGDSRLYRLRAGVLHCLTTDHAISTHRLTRALGVVEALHVDYAIHPRQSEDLYLLCSDGLSGSLDHDTLGRLLAAAQPAETLLAASLEAGATDNISLIIATPSVA